MIFICFSELSGKGSLVADAVADLSHCPVNPPSVQHISRGSCQCQGRWITGRIVALLVSNLGGLCLPHGTPIWSRRSDLLSGASCLRNGDNPDMTGEMSCEDNCMHAINMKWIKLLASF